MMIRFDQISKSGIWNIILRQNGELLLISTKSPCIMFRKLTKIAELKDDINTTDREIDQMVYKLYAMCNFS